MTTYQPNRSNLDEVTIELNQTGKSSTQVNLRHAILDEKKDYVFSVDSLQAPLNNCPIFNFEGEVFRIERRNVGELVTVNNDVDYQFAASFAQIAAGLPALLPPDTDRGIFQVGGAARKMYAISALVEKLNNFCTGFEQAYTMKGINAANMRAHGLDSAWAVDVPVTNATIVNHKLLVLEPRRVIGFGGWAGNDINALGVHSLLKFKLLPDYTLELWGSSNFWNHFVLVFTRTGAELLGFSDSLWTIDMGLGVQKHVLAQSIVAGQITNRASLVVAGVEHNALLYGPGPPAVPYRWNYGMVDRDLSVLSEHSLAQCADQRLKVVVTAHLPFQSNVAVLDNIETTTRSICEVYFVKDNRATLTFDAEGVLKSTSTESNVYAGDYQFIRKSDQFKQWTKLSTSYELRFLRFFLKIVYRVYDSNLDVWKLQTKDLDVPGNRMWSMVLRFVSEV